MTYAFPNATEASKNQSELNRLRDRVKALEDLISRAEPSVKLAKIIHPHQSVIIQQWENEFKKLKEIK